MVKIRRYPKSILPKFIIHHLPFTIFKIRFMNSPLGEAG